MKKSKTRIILSVAVSIALLAGCSPSAAKQEGASDTSQNQEGKPAAADTVSFPLAEPVTMSMFAIANNNVNLADNRAFQLVEKRTNVKWDLQSVSGVELEEKRGLLLATGQYPDVFYKAGLSQEVLDEYGTQGIFIPMNDLIEAYMPNLSKLMEENSAIGQAITSQDGNIYGLPFIHKINPSITSVWLNQSWLKTLGLKNPENLDELYTILKAFRDQDPNGNQKQDEIPLTALPGTLIDLIPYFGVNYDVSNNMALIDGNYEYLYTSDRYQEFLRYCSNLYAEGLLDPLTFTQNADQQKAVGIASDVFGSIINIGALQTVSLEQSLNYDIITPFEKNIYPVTAGIFPGTFAVTDHCKNPEIAMAWADQFYNEEGGRLALIGIEGESYKVSEDGTYAEDILLEGYDDIVQEKSYYNLQGSAHLPAKLPELSTTSPNDAVSLHFQSERDRVSQGDIGGTPFPYLRYDQDEVTTMISILADVDPYIKQYMAQVVSGELDLESSWDDYIMRLGNMRLDELTAIYTAAYEASAQK